MKTLVAMIAALFSLLITQTAHPQGWEWGRKMVKRDYISHAKEASSVLANANGITAIMVLIGVALTIIGAWMIYKRKALRISIPLLTVSLVVMALGMVPTGLHFHPLPHVDWLWAVPLGVLWAITKWTKFTRLDEWGYKTIIGVATVLILALRGLLWTFSPAVAVWWILLLVWVLAIAEAINDGFQTRPTLKFILLTLGWYLMAVLA